MQPTVLMAEENVEFMHILNPRESQLSFREHSQAMLGLVPAFSQTFLIKIRVSFSQLECLGTDNETRWHFSSKYILFMWWQDFRLWGNHLFTWAFFLKLVTL